MPDFDDDYDFEEDFTEAYDEEDVLDFEDSDVRELGSDPMHWGDGIARDEEDGWFYDDDDQNDYDDLHDAEDDYLGDD